MIQKRIKHLQIDPKDFSDRKYFPGTPGHLFHGIKAIQGFLSKIPFPIFAIIYGILTYFIFEDLPKTVMIVSFIVVDWMLLCLLPRFRISFGPPALTTLTLGSLRLPFLLFDFSVALAFQVFGTFLVLYGFYVEPRFPKTTHHIMTLSKASAEGRELRIVHMSDLHMEFLTSREERAVEIINALSPDIILYTGDFFNLSYQDNWQSHKDIIEFFDRLNPGYGTYAVTGSPSVDVEQSLASIEPDLNLKLLRDQIVELDVNDVPIQIIGLACTHQPARDSKRLKGLIQSMIDRDSQTSILLYHSPDIAPHLQSLPIDLQLSGHTHGGQVQIPFLGPIFTGSLYGHAFSSGHYLVNDSLNLVISRGLGLEGDAAPRVRFFSPPEICLITLEISSHHVKLSRMNL